jgi:hypothetical protein
MPEAAAPVVAPPVDVPVDVPIQAPADGTVRMWLADGTELELDERRAEVSRMRDIAASMMWRSAADG